MTLAFIWFNSVSVMLSSSQRGKLLGYPRNLSSLREPSIA